MPTPRRLLLAAALLALPLAASAQGDLTKTLAAMDQSSVNFKSFEANLEWRPYLAVLHDFDTPQSGTFYCQRVGSSTQMGIHFTQPSPMLLQIKNGIADKWIPGQDQEDRLKVAGAEGYLALGCGGSGKALADAWNIKDLGPETLTIDGKPIVTEKLDLVSKDANTRSNFSHITLWMDLSRDIALKQILYQPSGDYRTSLYSNLSYNKSVKTKPYAIPGNLKVMMH